MKHQFEWFNNLTKDEKKALLYFLYSHKPFVYQPSFKSKLRYAYGLLNKSIH